MNYLDDIQMVYKKTFSEATKRIKKNPIVLLLPFIYSFAMYVMNYVISVIGIYSGGSFLMGFIIAIGYALILSSYFSLLSDLHYYNRIGFKNIKSTFKNYFYAIYSAYFILMLINILSGAFGYRLSELILIAVFLIFNPLSEAIYIRGESYTSAYSYSMNFMKDNFIHWLIPLAIYMLIVNIFGYRFGEVIQRNIIEITLGQDVYFSFDMPSIVMIRVLLNTLLVQVITAFYVVFRAELFGVLSNSTMRKRQYMGGL
ncbi:hypothetical protein SAMN02745245_01363 [Anaerosphaera aminiphila DSM 21120]|uniref:Uncharacterized protein n=1 Tax=Anaerosphaera aminiphila DSM 21120 TaxID=1120995 RepID=A0A1M5T2P2_9FIRM|nr:hypothetical protein [Anaerosphaera aminiphila]SHH45011.1 hypothetical protein SAMN02745245_01363 [Anaerosphaera aminiphila DSM 21120]